MNKKLTSIIGAYCKVVEKGVNERWKRLPVEIYDSETYEVIGGLLSRQATLTIYLAFSPSIWNGHIAPLILRSMIDAHITLSWILIKPKERAKKYILYGLGQEKLHIEHLKSQANQKDKRAQQLIQAKENWLKSQRLDFLTEVNVGNWAEITTRQMAIESKCKSLYNFSYNAFSGPTHNMWQHISRYNLRYCNNPLHKYHRIPAIASVPPDIDYVFRSAKYVNLSFAKVDKKFGLRIKTPMPLQYFISRLNLLKKKRKFTT